MVTVFSSDCGPSSSSSTLSFTDCISVRVPCLCAELYGKMQLQFSVSYETLLTQTIFHTSYCQCVAPYQNGPSQDCKLVKKTYCC